MKTNIYSNKCFRCTQILVLLAVICLLFSVSGCEAFRKKFVRKSKRQKEVKVVIETYEYESMYSVEETYKRYFLFWRAAHEEMINSLKSQDGNRKKLVFAAEKIIENLQQMRQLLMPQMQARLDTFISEQKDIARQLNRFKLQHAQLIRIKSMLEKQRRQIQKEFNYKHIQEYLVKE